MYLCGVVPGPGVHHLCALREARAGDPPVRLKATFFKPGPTAAVAARVRELGEAAVGIAAPMTPPRGGRDRRVCDELLEQRGVLPLPFSEHGQALFEELADLGLYGPGGEDMAGDVSDGAYTNAPVFETNIDAVFSALGRRRLPARRHPLGIQRRIQELLDAQVMDEGGNLWHRRIDEIEAAAAALCAHRYAVGLARWIGDPAEGVIVIPGRGPLAEFPTRGVVPPVARMPL